MTDSDLSSAERVKLPQELVPLHYDLQISPDLESFEFTGQERIDVTVAVENVSEVQLHCREICVHSAYYISTELSSESNCNVNGVPKRVEIQEISYNERFYIARLSFATSLPIGHGQLHLTYRGVLNNDMAGFYRSSYIDATGAEKIMACTQFAALDARRAFLCWDEPAVKATFSLSLIIPSHLTALSNMPEISSQYLPAATSTTSSTTATTATSIAAIATAGINKSNKRSNDNSSGVSYKRVVFATTPLMSTYLLAFAVGEFDFVSGVTSAAAIDTITTTAATTSTTVDRGGRGGVQLRVYTAPGRAEEGRFALEVALRALEFYDRFFQLPYPLPKMDFLSVPEFQFGATENWGLVTFREADLLINSSTVGGVAAASAQQRQRVATVVAHELAHQWFGNLVTMAWWDGLWLNEGFATFMQYLCIAEVLPEYHIWDFYTVDAFSRALQLDALSSSHPVIVPIKHAQEVEQVFDAISYCKGSAVVNMVAAILGANNFQRGLQLYMQRHKYAATETTDLWDSWSEVCDYSYDVAALMHTWTTCTGFPVITVLQEQWHSDSVVVTLQQQRFLSDGSSTSSNNSNSSSVNKNVADSVSNKVTAAAELWCVPLYFATPGATSAEAAMMTQRIQTFTIPLLSTTANNNYNNTSSINNSNNNNGSSGCSSDLIRPWVKINTGQRALVRVRHSEEMTSRLLDAVAADPNAISAVDKAALLLDASCLSAAGLVSAEAVVPLLRVLQNDHSAVVWHAIPEVIGSLSRFMEQLTIAIDHTTSNTATTTVTTADVAATVTTTDTTTAAAISTITTTDTNSGGSDSKQPSVRTAYKNFCRTLVVKALAAVGWEPHSQQGHDISSNNSSANNNSIDGSNVDASSSSNSNNVRTVSSSCTNNNSNSNSTTTTASIIIPNGEEHTITLARSRIIALLDSCAWDDSAVAAEAQRRFDAHWSDPKQLPADYKTTVYRIVLKNGGLPQYEQLLEAYNRIEVNQERKYIMMSLGAANSDELKLRTLQWAYTSGRVKLQDIYIPIGGVASDMQGALLCWRYFTQHFESIKQQLSNAFPALMDAVIVNSISRFNTLQQAQEVESFFAANPLPSSARRIHQVLEVIRAAAKNLTADSFLSSPLASIDYWNNL